MDVKFLKDELIGVLHGIDKSKLTLFELQTYASILQTINGIGDVNFYQEALKTLTDSSIAFGGNKPATISDLK